MKSEHQIKELLSELQSEVNDKKTNSLRRQNLQGGIDALNFVLSNRGAIEFWTSGNPISNFSIVWKRQ